MHQELPNHDYKLSLLDFSNKMLHTLGATTASVLLDL